MLIIDKIKVEKALYDSYEEVIQSYGKEVYYILYDNNKITPEMAERILKNRLNNIYDRENIPYMDYIIIITEEQFNNLLKGRLKNRDSDFI